MGAGNVTFDGHMNSRIWTISSSSGVISNFTIMGITFQNGYSTDEYGGGALLFKNTLKDSVINANFINNRAYYQGGAIAFTKSTNAMDVHMEAFHDPSNIALSNVSITGYFYNNAATDPFIDEWIRSNDKPKYEIRGGAIYYSGSVINCSIGGVYIQNHITVFDKDNNMWGGVNCFNGLVQNTSITGYYIINGMDLSNIYIPSNIKPADSLWGGGGVNAIYKSRNLIINGTFMQTVGGYDGGVNYFGTGEHDGLILDGIYSNNHAVAYENGYEGSTWFEKIGLAFKEYYEQHKVEVWVQVGLTLATIIANEALGAFSATLQAAILTGQSAQTMIEAMDAMMALKAVEAAEAAAEAASGAAGAAEAAEAVADAIEIFRVGTGLSVAAGGIADITAGLSTVVSITNTFSMLKNLMSGLQIINALSIVAMATVNGIKMYNQAQAKENSKTPEITGFNSFINSLIDNPNIYTKQEEKWVNNTTVEFLNQKITIPGEKIMVDVPIRFDLPPYKQGHGAINFFASPLCDAKIYGSYNNNTAEQGAINYFKQPIELSKNMTFNINVVDQRDVCTYQCNSHQISGPTSSAIYSTIGTIGLHLISDTEFRCKVNGALKR